MLAMNEFVDLRMQQQIAHEIYRQQIMQRIPDPFPSLLALPMPHHIIVPPRPTLPGAVEAKLENNDLWQQFHKIGTEMIITKSGRRMFPSMRVSLSGLEEESNYCVLLEMVPIGDCRYKFSGSQWVPAGGAEPQSPQRMFLHPDSPATGTHWQSQAILFNKVKLTNNTLDSNGHIVLASMHKYQPRLHIIRTSDLTQLPWAPQQAFIFPETEFVAVTAYQNDRITKLKIDNNPFAKGFRETGQSRCKRKLTSSLCEEQEQDAAEATTTSPSKSQLEDDRSSIGSYEAPQLKRVRSSDSCDDEGCFSSSFSSGSISPRIDEIPYQHMPSSMYTHPQPHQQQHHHLLRTMSMSLDVTTAAYLNAAAPPQLVPKLFLDSYHHLSLPTLMPLPLPQQLPAALPLYCNTNAPNTMETERAAAPPQAETDSSQKPELYAQTVATTSSDPATHRAQKPTQKPKRNSFSISAILAY